MNSRERVLASINHQSPDRVPIDIGATPSSGISVIAYNNLKKHLGLSGGHTRVYDVVQQLVQPEDQFLDQFKVDVIDIGQAFNTNDSDWYDIDVSDGSKAQYPKWFKPTQDEKGYWHAYMDDGTKIATMPTHATFFDQTCFPWLDGYPDDLSCLEDDMGKILWAALVHSPWDNAGQADFWKQLREKTLRLKQHTDKALMINCGCNLFEWGTFLRRMDNFLMDLYREPTNVERFLNALMKIHMETLAKVCEAVGDIVDIIRFGDDLGMDSGPFMPLDKYRRFFHQHRTQLCNFVKNNSQMHTFLHTCGSVYKFIPDFIESGIEIINPVQTNCRDMEPEKLKHEFGNDIVFWGGGVDTRNILNRGSVADVKDQVKQRLEIFSPNGGFIFNPIHNILPDVPPENIIAMFDAIKEYNQGV